MKAVKLQLPFGDVQVLVNGEAIEFEYENSSYNTYYL